MDGPGLVTRAVHVPADGRFLKLTSCPVCGCTLVAEEDGAVLALHIAWHREREEWPT